MKFLWRKLVKNMANKLNFLITVSLKRKIYTKWFLIANILLFLLIVSIANIDSIISFFGGDFDQKQQVYVIDETERTFDIFKEQLALTEGQLQMTQEAKYEVHLVTDDEFPDFDYEEVIEEDDKAIVIILEETENIIGATVITEVFLDTINYQIITSALNSTRSTLALLESDIDAEELAKVTAPIEIERIILDETKDSEAELQAAVMTTIFPFVILPFFMLTIFLVQMIGAEVNDEKSTRGMEIIISSVSPKVHFFAKIIAGNLFVIMQGALLFIFGVIAFFSRKLFATSTIPESVDAEINNFITMILDSDIGGQLGFAIPLTIILMLLTFLAYALLAGILASMTTNIEDFQQLQTPIVIISVIGYYLSIMAGIFTGATFIKVFSFVPLISAILAPSLLILEQISIYEVLISIAIMIGFNYLLIKYGLKIYKVGILNYSTTDLWKKMFKALKN